MYAQANLDGNAYLDLEEIRSYIVQDNPNLSDEEYDRRAEELMSVLDFFDDDNIAYKTEGLIGYHK